MCRLCGVCFLLCATVIADDKAPIKVGMIGLDTSHAVAFTQQFERLRARPDVPAVAVVAGCPQSVSDNPSSFNRVKGYTETLRTRWKVQIVDTIEELLPLCDAVMIESVDGRPHLEQARPVFAAGKPLFIDKPLAGSYADAKEIVRLSKESGVPFFSASALRFCGPIYAMKSDPALGAVLGCDTRSPCSFEKHHPDLYWYGIHGVDPLYLFMGTGCVEVWRVHTEHYDLVAGRWADGRIGTFRGMRRGGHSYSVTVWGEKGYRHSPAKLGSIYEGLIVQIATFFRTKKPPIDPEETLESFAFMSAADLSKKRGGAPVKLSEVPTD
jgi:predicted dehydrogenase